MTAAVRSCLTAAVTLAGSGIVTAAAVAPAPQHSHTRVVAAAVNLAAAVEVGQACSGYYIEGCDIWAPQTYTPVPYDPEAGSWGNVPANLLNAVLSIPRALVDGLNDLSYSFEVTGSWWVYTPTNVLGFDPADPPKVAALFNLLIPFAPLSQPLAESFNWWAKANLTMNAGCTGTTGPTCPDLGALLATMFRVPTWTLTRGYTFPDVVLDPVSPLEGSMGNPLPEGYPGNIDREVGWSGAYVKLDPRDPEYSVLNYLKADPATNRPEPVTFAEVVSSITRFVKASQLDFYPFVPMSFLLKGWPYTFLTPLFKPFLPWLCPDCNPLNPAWPPGATEQPWPSAAVPEPAPAPAEAATAEVAPVSALAATEPVASAAPAELAVTPSAVPVDPAAPTVPAQQRVAKPAAAVAPSEQSPASSEEEPAPGDAAPAPSEEDPAPSDVALDVAIAELPVETADEPDVPELGAPGAAETDSVDAAQTDQADQNGTSRSAARAESSPRRGG